MGSLFAFLILFGSQAPGTTPECTALARELLPILAFARERDYRVLMCSDNVERLSQRLVKVNFSLPHGRIIHLRRKGVPYVALNPQKARLRVRENVYRPPHWMFHAIFVVDGLVLDLDYRDEAHVVGINTYMREMWDEEELQETLFQEKSVTEEGGYDRSGLLNEQRYPSQNYSEWSSRYQGACADAPDLLL